MLDEFALIRQFFAKPIHRPDIAVGIGDDAAIVVPPADHGLAVTTDTLVAGVHFAQTVAAADLGYKALAVNLSDLAAMGAVPQWFTLALTLPSADEAWVGGFAEGLFDIAEKYRIALVGGDTTRGPLAVTITAMGSVPVAAGARRSGARAGDDIYVTGRLGDAALGLAHLEGRVALAPHEAVICMDRLLRPEPRIMAGLALRGLVSSMIDCSDGFAADLGHILDASEVGAEVRLASLPVSGPVRRVCESRGDWTLPLAGGDDYELIFTAAASQRREIAALVDALDCPITWVGSIRSGSGLDIYDPDGNSVPLAHSGYRHF